VLSLAAAHNLISSFQAIVLGVLQGATELFPVSSLGHTVLFPNLFGWHNVVAWQSESESPWLAFVVMLHVGSAIGLLIYFWRDWVAIVKAFFATLGKRRIETPTERLAWLIISATIPVGILGVALEHPIRVALAKPLSAAIFLMVNGCILLAAERFRRRAEVRALALREGLNEEGSRRLETLEFKEAGVIGVAQSSALIAGISRDGMSALVAAAIDTNRIDLYLQPIVTLPQRKVRYYEAVSRLRTEQGDVVPAVEFIDVAESAGLMPKLDNLLMFRCVQVTRRLQLKSRDVGLFCNVSASTLVDPTFFRQFLDFMDANRALANALMFEFTQSAYRAFGPLEHESLAALSERGFRFSMDHVTDLRMEPKELADRSFRFLKVPAKLLLNPAATAQSDIHPGDLADLLARSGVDLIAERIESESMVIDLLDFDVRFGQGFLFSPPRPVRVEALQTAAADAGKPAQEATSELAAAGAVNG